VARTTYTFDAGTDEANVTAAGGIVAVSGPPTYEAAAAFHGPMGVQTTGIQWAEWAVPALSFSGSLYISPRAAAASGSSRFMTVMSTAAGTQISLRFNVTGGAIHVADSANALLGAAATTTWAVNDRFRFDWQGSYNAGADTFQLDVRIFKGAAVESVTPTESLSRTGITGFTNDPARVRVGSQTTGAWDFYIDTLTLSDQLEWIGPYANPFPFRRRNPQLTFR
jgi:hypothetical protein